MGKLKVTIVKASFPKKPVRKVKVQIVAGKDMIKTKEVAPGSKDKTKEPAWNEEHVFDNFDPKASFSIELFTSKGSLGQLGIGNGLGSLFKFKQGETVEKSFDFGEVSVLCQFTPVDFGEAAKPPPKPASPGVAVKKPPSIAGMPSEDEINRQFATIARDMGLGPEKVKNMTKENKWQLIQAASANAGPDEGEEGKVSFWMEKLKKPDDKILRKIQFHLGSKTSVWVEEFHKAGGLVELHKILTGILSAEAASPDQKKMKKTIAITWAKVGIGKAGGASLILKTGDALDKIMILASDQDLEVKERADILKLLQFICTIPGGHRAVLSSANNYQKLKKEKSRFQTLVKGFITTNVPQILAASLGFFNALIGNPKDLDTRNRIRRELNSLSFKSGLDKLRKFESEDEALEAQIDDEIDTYDQLVALDEKQLKTRFDHVGDTANIVFSSSDWLFNKVKENVAKEAVVREEVYPKEKHKSSRDKKTKAKGEKSTPSEPEIVEKTVKPPPEIARYLNDLLVDLVGVNLEGEWGKPQWAVAARFIRQLSLLESVDTSSDDSISAIQRIPLEQLLASVQLTEEQDTFPLNAECEKFRAEVEEMKAEGAKIDASVAANQKILKTKKDQILSLQDTLDTRLAAKNRSKHELEELTNDLAEKTQQLQDLTERQKAVESQLTALENEFSEQKIGTEKYEASKESLTTKIADIKKQVEVHQRMQAASATRVDPVKKQFDLLNLEVADLQEKLAALVKEHSAPSEVKKTFDELNAKLKTAREEAEKLSKTLEGLPERSEPDAETLAAKAKKAETLKGEVDQTKSQLVPLEDSIKELKAEAASLESKIKECASAPRPAGDSGAGGPPAPPDGAPMARGGPPAPMARGGPPPPPGGGMARGGPPPPPGGTTAAAAEGEAAPSEGMARGGPPPPPGGMARGGPPPPPGGRGGPPPPPGPAGRGGPPPPPGPGGRGPPPPPGGRGGPPGPPGPMGRGRGGPAAEPEIPDGPKPEGKVKPFNWKKVPHTKKTGTVFEKFGFELSGIKLDFSQIESKFAVVQKSAAEVDNTPKKAEKTLMVFLDPKVAQNLNIWISKYKRTMSNKEIILAVQNINKEIFDSAAVAALITFIPTADEVSQMKEYLDDGGDFNQMGSAEQFSIEYSKVGQLDQRLKCFQTVVDFEPKKVDLMPDIATLEKCSKFITNDKRIEKFCEIILSIGNFLNNGNKRLGEALGFKLETIAKLGDTKTSDNKKTILDVVVEMLMNNEKDEHKGLLKFAKDELDLVSAGARLSLPTVEAELRTLQKTFNVALELAPKIQTAGDDDKFQAQFTAFSEKATDDMNNMVKDFENAQTSYNAVVRLMGEDPAKMAPDEFFVIWQGLLQKIVATAEQIAVERDKAEKLAKREQAKAAREGGAGGPGPSRGRGRGRGA